MENEPKTHKHWTDDHELLKLYCKECADMLEFLDNEEPKEKGLTPEELNAELDRLAEFL